MEGEKEIREGEREVKKAEKERKKNGDAKYVREVKNAEKEREGKKNTTRAYKENLSNTIVSTNGPVLNILLYTNPSRFPPTRAIAMLCFVTLRLKTFKTKAALCYFCIPQETARFCCVFCPLLTSFLGCTCCAVYCVLTGVSYCL